MFTVTSQTTICNSCKHEWDITEFMYEDSVICPKCSYKNEIGVRIISDCPKCRNKDEIN